MESIADTQLTQAAWARTLIITEKPATQGWDPMIPKEKKIEAAIENLKKKNRWFNAIQPGFIDNEHYVHTQVGIHMRKVMKLYWSFDYETKKEFKQNVNTIKNSTNYYECITKTHHILVKTESAKAKLYKHWIWAFTMSKVSPITLREPIKNIVNIYLDALFLIEDPTKSLYT